MDRRLKRIGMLIFDGADLLDFAGPTTAFFSAARHLIRTGRADSLLYEIELLSIDGGMIRTLQGVQVETKAAPELSPGEYDTVIVTGGLADHQTCDPRLIEWVSRNHDKPRRVASVCCGAFILAGAGILDGRAATTHWEDCGHLQESFPDIEVRPDCIYVQDGIHAAFVAKLTEQVAGLKVGDGAAPEVVQGPLINAKAVAKVAELVGDAVDRGARIETGGKPHALGGTWFEPTVLSGMQAPMRLAQEEAFGLSLQGRSGLAVGTGCWWRPLRATARRSFEAMPISAFIWS